jgi:hypothetical protein
VEGVRYYSSEPRVPGHLVNKEAERSLPLLLARLWRVRGSGSTRSALGRGD